MINDISVLSSILSVGGLLFFAYGPWQWFCTDRARQRLFVQRHRLFDLALQGRMAFSDEAYRSTRSHINDLIRFAHEASWTRFLYLGFHLKRLKYHPGKSVLDKQMRVDR